MTVNVGVDLHKTQFTVCMPNNGKPGFETYAATMGVWSVSEKRKTPAKGGERSTGRR